MSIRQCFITLIRDEEGLATVEYAVLLAGLIIGLSVTWQPLGDAMSNTGEKTQQAIAAGEVTGVGCQ